MTCLFSFKDYHVICVYKMEDGEAVVYDLDSRLSFPCLFNEYVAKAIQPDELLEAEFHRYVMKSLYESSNIVCYAFHIF